MTTGIYRLTFRSGRLYIGQSVDIETRWSQHFDKFSKGTAAKSMQIEYDLAGSPTADILKVCHKDHLDMMESLYINSSILRYGSKVLNSVIPKDYTNKEIDIISENETYLQYSIVELIEKLVHNKGNVTALEAEVATLRDEGIRLPVELEGMDDDIKTIRLQIDALVLANQQLSKRANMSWLDRLFS